MKLLLGAAALGFAVLSFAGSDDKQPVTSCTASSMAVYQDTIPKKDSSNKKNRKDKKDKKERRDTLAYRL